jgi:hypothetical protein
MNIAFLPIFVRNRLRELFPMTGFSGNLPLTDCGLQLMNEFLNMDPTCVSFFCTFIIFLLIWLQRITASDALSHPWLKTESPSPTLADLMPTFKSRHE